MANNILIVDDDMINRKLIAKIISKKGYQFKEAANGVEALDAVKQGPVDLVLLDLMMPVMNGMEFLQEIRRDPNYMNLPIIVLTTDDSKRSEVINLGANDIMIKPVNPTELLEKLEAF